MLVITDLLRRLKDTSDLLSRKFSKTENGLVCPCDASENQFGLTKKEWDTWPLGCVVDNANEGGLLGALNSNRGAPPKSSSSKIGVVLGSIAKATPLYTSTESRCHRRPLVAATSDVVAMAASLPMRLIVTSVSGWQPPKSSKAKG